ncbi:MAG: eukaryotic-like serine/threonine-protein kinase [Acidobacteriota bacterium]|nr:eukaryotic-like serine/threonine-protein kinase [Acidobacteriota bacterium]
MEPDRWRQVWTLFHGALECAEGEVRAAFLDEACTGDSGLRAELDSLLVAHRQSDTGSSGSASEATVLLGADTGPDGRIGPYRLVRRIGEGGMGVVYEAVQEEPVRRRVALKLIKLGMDTREVVRRFEAERQALAMMDHSSIARVFDAGATPGGRPYFAMELVDGPSLTDFCDAWQLAIAQRVALVATVCRAVHSAHQKGVIHRDIKASNVLVAAEEGGPVPKVIDFGIARAIERGPMGESLHTRLGELVGTPETMSPEQAAMSGDLDTRTDIYSLGALLYEILTGAKAFEFSSTPFPEILRRIRETEPPPPSARFAGAAPGAPDRAAKRSGAAAQLRREIRGELDWIVARAMAKQRDRRYGSAAELAADLERFLAHLPVSAGPPSGLYRARKFVERHRAEAFAAAVLLVALVGFGTTMALQSRRLALALTVQERERATATEVSRFLVALLERPDPAVARGADPTVKQALEWGAARIERDLAGQPEIQARLLETIGGVQLNLGALDKAEPALRKALEVRRRLHGEEHVEVAAALHHLGELEFELARYPAALELARLGLAMRRRLLPAGDPALADSLDLLALLERQAGDLEGAAELHRQALEIRRTAYGEKHPAVAESWNYLGIVRRWSDDSAGAEEAYRKALEIWRRELGEDHPKTAMAMNNLALTVHVRGDHPAAKRIFDELVPLRRKLLGDVHPDLQVTLNNYAKLLHDMRDLVGAAAVYEESIAIGRRSGGEEGPLSAAAFADLSAVLSRLGRFDEAVAAAQRALAIRERVFGAAHPTVAAALAYLAQAHEARGDDLTAGPLHERAVAILRRSAPGEPRLAQGIETQALFLLRTGRTELARPLLDEAVAIFRARLPPEDRRRARAEGSLGACLTRQGLYDQAEPLLVESLGRLAPFETPETAEARARLAELERARGSGRAGAD